MEEKSAKKRKRSKSEFKSKPTVLESDHSDDEISDYGNGHEVTMMMNEMDDSGSSDGNGWSSDDDHELVEKVKSTAKENDKVNYKTRLRQMDWKEIAFKNYTAEDCEKRFTDHLKHIRRYRNLSEVVVDIEANIKKCPLKKPLNSYQLFVKDQLMNATTSGDFAETMRTLASRYKSMPAEERAIYELQATQLRQEYKVKKMELASGNLSVLTKAPTPGPSKVKTPFMLYAESHPAETDYSKLREDYANLTLDEKYKLVNKAVSLAPEEHITKILNKEEQRIFKGQLKQSPSAYSLFVKDVYAKFKEKYGAKDIFVEIAHRWKSLNTEERQPYIDQAIMLKEKMTKDQQAFNKRHGVTPQKVRRRKSVFAERPTVKESEDEAEERATFVLPKSKKRHLSGSSAVESSSDDTKTKKIKIEKNSPLQSPSKSPLKTPTKSSPVPATVNHTPSNDVKEKKKVKLNSMSEASDFNDKVESDAASSSASTSSKKKSKKEKKEKKEKSVEPPTDKPPSSIDQYFAKHIHTGKPHKALKAFNKLTKKELKELRTEYNEKVESYVKKLKAYLASMSQEEAIAYIAKVKETGDAVPENSEEGSSQEY